MNAHEYLAMKEKQRAIKRETFWQAICMGMGLFMLVWSVIC